MIRTDEQLLTVNPYSRPGKKLVSVKAIVLHYVQDPGASAQAIRNYFESLKDQQTGPNPTYGSTQYVIGLEGEVIQMIPDDEMAYHVGADHYSRYALAHLSEYPNNCTIGIGLCHLDVEGRFAQKTLASAAFLVTDLVRRHNLDPLEDVTTHWEITGKECPLWFVTNPGDFCSFKSQVRALIL